jgi:hypothetical protein
MTHDQKRARVFGVLYLIMFATSIPALALYETVLRHPAAYIAGSGHDKQVLFVCSSSCCSSSRTSAPRS